MTAPLFASEAVTHYNRLKARHISRDQRHHLVHEIRRGNMRGLFPEELNLSISFDGVPIGNFIDTTSRDLAEVTAPLPALACTSGKMKTDADQKRAEIKNRIGGNYWTKSLLESQMLTGADNYYTYGFLPFFVEPYVDYDNDGDEYGGLPYIQVEDPKNSYYELDRWCYPTIYAKRWLRSVDDLAAQFPEYENQIRLDPKTNKKEHGETELELVRWVDKTSVSLFLPSRDGLVLGSYQHKLSRLPVWIAERPGSPGHPRGQFDDVVWVQVARAIMSTLALEAASIAVQAPIAAPSDMDEFPIGPHAILQSDDANQIRRVGLELPPTIFAENQNLDQELKAGSRYPDARAGGIQASVITGKGVEALLGTFDTQIKGAQMVMREALQQVTSLCFEMDEVWWPNSTKTVAGILTGTSFEFDYTPARDINGRWDCRVTYGFAAGMNPAQSIVTMLQLQGAGLIAEGTVQDNLPFDIDQLKEQKKIQVERTRQALMQGLFSVIQSAGPMALQGQDPMPYLKMAADTLKSLQDGEAVEKAITSAFETMEQAQKQAAEEAQQQAEQQVSDQGGGGGSSPLGPDGLPEGVAPGQAGLPPGGMATVSQLVSGFRGDASTPVNSATIRRNVPTGT